MSHRNASSLLLAVLSVGLAIGALGHACDQLPSSVSFASGVHQLVEPINRVADPDRYCPACFLLRHSRATADTLGLQPPAPPDLSALVGRQVNRPTARAARQLPPSRAPPLLS